MDIRKREKKKNHMMWLEGQRVKDTCYTAYNFFFTKQNAEQILIFFLYFLKRLNTFY